MSQHAFRSRPSFQALDFGLRVRIEVDPAQRTIFSGAENFNIQELTSELAELVSELRVRSFTIRHDLECITQALQVNVECDFWPLARRAALDLSGLLKGARRFADPELCYRGSECASRIAGLCAREVD